MLRTYETNKIFAIFETIDIMNTMIRRGEAMEDSKGFYEGISHESSEPLYKQLIKILRHQIESGILKEGDLAPSEADLCAKYSLSRSTVRQAYNTLVEEGFIIRRRGKGTFISSSKMNRSINHLYSFSEDMRQLGKVPSSKVVESEVIKVNQEIAAKLGITNMNSMVYKLKRVRLANDEPILYETTYIPVFMCYGIEKEDFAQQSLYEVLSSKYQLQMIKAVETYEIRNFTKEEAALLKIEAGKSGFNINRIAVLENGTPFEWTQSMVRSDMCKLSVELTDNASKNTFIRSIQP